MGCLLIFRREREGYSKVVVFSVMGNTRAQCDSRCAANFFIPRRVQRRVARLLWFAAVPRQIAPALGLVRRLNRQTAGPLPSFSFDVMNKPHAAMNSAAITGPITKPLMPNNAMPPMVDISTR